MARKIALLILVVVAASALLACQGNNDAKTTFEVKARITEDERLDAADIDVETKDGVVTLKGKVLGKEEEKRAIELARSVSTARNVVSKLEVDTRITDSDVEERVEENEEIAEEKREEDVDAGQTVDDASTTAKVKLALAKDDTVKAYKIDVDTENGVVTLTGTVKNATEAKRAIQVAETIEGVKRVNSVLTIGS